MEDEGDDSEEGDVDPPLPAKSLSEPLRSHPPLNTLHNYFSSTPAFAPPSPPTASPIGGGVTSDVAAVLSLLSPHDANFNAQRSAMKKISRIHHQLASDIVWDPGKQRGRGEEQRKRRERDSDRERDGSPRDSDSSRTPHRRKGPKNGKSKAKRTTPRPLVPGLPRPSLLPPLMRMWAEGRTRERPIRGKRESTRVREVKGRGKTIPS